GALNAHPRAGDEDLARIRGMDAVEDIHQRRLAGAVLADEAMDDAARERQRHVAIGEDRAEALADAAELGGGGCAHGAGREAPGVAAVSLFIRVIVAYCRQI